MTIVRLNAFKMYTIHIMILYITYKHILIILWQYISASRPL